MAEVASISTAGEEQAFIVHLNKCTAEFSGNLKSGVQRAVDLANLYARSFARDDGVGTPELVDEFIDFFRLCENEFIRGNAEERARVSASNFEFDPGVVERDGVDLARLGSIQELVRERQSQNRPDRFNEERCQKVFAEVDNAEILMDLAVNGATVFVGEDFEYQSTPDKPRNLQLRLGKCFSVHALKLWKAGGALILREEDVPLLEAARLNFNPLHWTTKGEDGRMLCDLSNRPQGHSINCPESKLMVEHEYGSVIYPTIDEIVMSYLEYADTHGYELYMLRIWKEDVRGAFGQFNINPSDAYKLAFQFAVGLIMIVIGGFFGWTGAPMVFANFSKGMLQVLRLVIVGRVFLFCDDFMGCAHFAIAADDQRKARVLIDDTFGADSWASEKSVLPAQSAELIGWWVDLVAETIRPSDKGIRKLIFAFFLLEISASHWSLEVCQLIASLAQRYSCALVGMRPFVNAFYEMCGGSQDIKWRRVSAKARFAVEIWRVTVLRLYLNPAAMSLSLRVFVKSSVGLRCEKFITDGSYIGTGVLFLDNVEGLLENNPHVSYLCPFKLKDSKYQNHREFLGLIVALLCLLYLRRVPSQGVVVHWINDNTSALDWAEKNMCKGAASQAAFMLFTELVTRFKIQIVQTEHIPGLSETMKPVDALSRAMEAPSLNIRKKIDLSSVKVVDDMMMICNPIISRECVDYHISFAAIHLLVNAFEQCII